MQVYVGSPVCGCNQCYIVCAIKYLNNDFPSNINPEVIFWSFHFCLQLFVVVLTVLSLSEASPVIAETGYGLTGLGGLGLLGHGPILTLGHGPAVVAPRAVDYYVSMLLIFWDRPKNANLHNLLNLIL